MAQLWHFQTDGSDQPLFKPTVLICFAIRASGFSIFKLHFPPRKSSRAKDMMTRGFHRSMVEIPSGLRTPEKSNLKPPLPSVLLPGARDLMTRGSCRSTTEILSGLRTSGNSKLKLIFPSKFMDFCPRVPADGWSIFSSDFGGLRR
jgi:hypothetical protein